MLGKIAFEAIDKARGDLEAASKKMWENPEGPFKEFIACDVTCELLEKYGFKVERGLFGVPTSIRATWGSGHPAIGLLGEFDALPGLSQAVSTERSPVPGQNYGQGCGHNLLGLAHVGAAIGLKAEMEAGNLPGTIVFYDCPAEEVLTGKGYMARGGAFKDIDLCIAFHPSTMNAVGTGSSNALNNAKFHFHGVTAHAGGDPHNGRSALDGVEIMNVGANYLREHVETDVRIHYAITHGGTAPNIVPDYACVWYYVRAPKRERVEDTYKRLCKVAEGAAMISGTTVEIEYMGGCYNTLNNKVLAEVALEAMNEVPKNEYTPEEIEFARKMNDTKKEQLEAIRKRFSLPADMEIHEGVAPMQDISGGGSTDVGDVQHIVPGIMIRTACYNIGAPGHSWQITACSGHSIGNKGMHFAGKTMALFGLKVINDPNIYKKAKEEFDSYMGGSEYVCPITPELKIPE